MARAGLIPKPVAKMSSRGVPMFAILLSGGIAGALAFLVNLDSMWNFVSIGTLFAYGGVCLACLWRRYNQSGTAKVESQVPTLHKCIMAAQITGIIAMGMLAGFGFQYYPDNNMLWAVPTAVFFPLTAGFHFFPQRYQLAPTGFTVSPMPWVPACGIMINSFLIGSLGQMTFIFWGVWMAVAITVYLVYGLHHTQGEGDPSFSSSRADELVSPREGSQNSEMLDSATDHFVTDGGKDQIVTSANDSGMLSPTGVTDDFKEGEARV